jgi:hypothetical protein
MSEISPSNAEDAVSSILATQNDADQIKADKQRLQNWLGYNPQKDSFTEKQIAKAESMSDYLQSRPANQEQLAALEEMQADKIENTDGEYEPTSDMDKELAYLEQEFSSISDPEDVAAALDLVSDFCDDHNLDRAAEKQLRSRLLNKYVEVQQATATTHKTAGEPGVASSAGEAETTTTTGAEGDANGAEVAEELALGTRVQLTNENGEHRIGIITKVVLDENHPTGVYYEIKPENGTDGELINAHIEDLTEVADDVIIPEIVDTTGDSTASTTGKDQDIIDAVIVEDASGSDATTSETIDGQSPLENGFEPVTDPIKVTYTDKDNTEVKGVIIASTADNSQYVIRNNDGAEVTLRADEFVVVATDKQDNEGADTTTEDNTEAGEEQEGQKSDWEKIKAAPTAMYVAITTKLAESRKKWNELDPKKKRTYAIIGGAAVVATGLLLAALAAKGHDTSGLSDATSTGGTSSAEGVATNSPPIGDSTVGTNTPNLTNTQRDFAESYANTPWQAAVDTYGSDQAAEALQTAVKKAQAAGENIKTFGEGTSWKIQANGSWNTQEVAKILAEYMPKK